MNLTFVLSVIIIGLLAGILSGVFGVGGGVVMVPLLIFLLGYTQHQAQGTSLAVLAIPVTFIGAYNYHVSGHEVNWKVALIIAVSFVLGAYFGSKFAISLDQKILKKIFGGILIIVALKMIFGK